MNGSNGFFVHCSKCGKKLIKRLPNGLWHFAFGRKRGKGGTLSDRVPVELWVHGSIKIKCPSDGCGQINVLTYFPNPVESLGNPSESIDTIDSSEDNISLSETTR